MTYPEDAAQESKKKQASESSNERFQPNDESPSRRENVLNINVGVLGHVDSGKTSLVKALSTLLSTAALDKSKQSRQRGMTLDLGFSCFFLDGMPPQLKEWFSDESDEQNKVQITLVDCPGHASLIRTIIGGAQIIDMVLLVVDAVKGWQAQTTECLVLAELTSPNLVIALNKVDQFPEEQREDRIEQAKTMVWERLKNTRFAQAPAVGVSACVGGEKVAAAPADDASTRKIGSNETFNVDTLVRVLRESLRPPIRQHASNGTKPGENPFYFSIDHCFPIRGRGTVLTGTVLNGFVSVNDVIEFPSLGLQRKVKSMQMFKRQVPTIGQGDRAGICVSNLDAKLIERGTAATPGTVRLLSGAIAVVRKISHYTAGTLKTGSKFHVSVGHTTVMATVTFWGARELLEQHQSAFNGKDNNGGDVCAKDQAKGSQKLIKSYVGSSSLGGDADLAGLPRIAFSYKQDFVQQDQLLEVIDGQSNPLHWALLEFQIPIYCPMESLVIGSRLDIADAVGTAGAEPGSVTSCRLAFAGRLMESVDVEQGDVERIRLYTLKERRGVIGRLGEPHKRNDDGKVVRYEVFGADLFKKETNMKVFVGMKVQTENTGDVGEIKSSYGTEGQFRVAFPAGTEGKEGEGLILRFKRYLHDSSKSMHQDAELPPARPGTRIEAAAKKSKKQVFPKGIKPHGEVVSLKGDVLDNGKYTVAIISGFFSMEVNIRERAGSKVRIPSTKEEGTIIGPFGKAGKCKVSFPNGISAEAGSKAELHLS
ncbi:hypothetical protein ACA910_002369 [Epithemia clementina (nom. ined.)]